MDHRNAHGACMSMGERLNTNSLVIGQFALAHRRVMPVQRSILVAGALASMAVAHPALAADAAADSAAATPTDQIGEIVVTARRKEENLQSTPVSITAISAAALEVHNVVSLEQVSRLAPNLSIYATVGSVGGASVYVRGIGTADNTVGQDSPIGLYIDGVSSARVGTAVLQLVEPERIEVLRGPQGTLFGRNTTGGALLITTHTPTDDFSGMVKASYGSYDTRSVQARVDSGLLGDSGIKLSLAYRHHQQDGYIDNGLRPARDDPGSERGDAYFAKLVGSWGRLTATLTGDYSKTEGTPASIQVVAASDAVRRFVSLSPANGGGAYEITTKPLFKIANDSEVEQRVWSRGVAATLNYAFSNHLSLKSISAFRGYERTDPSGDGPGLLAGNVGTVANPHIVFFNGLYELLNRGQKQHQFSQEMQLLGSAGDFDFVLGGYYFKEGGSDRGTTRIAVVLGQGDTALDFSQTRNFTVESKSIAGFGQLSWRPQALDRRLELTGGLRWTQDNRDFNQTLNVVRAAALKDDNVSYLLSASYQWTPAVMTFARYSTGYRAGGFNARVAANVNPVYQPEKLKSLEVGIKGEFFDRHLRLNGSVYYNRYADLQVAQFVPATSTTNAGGNQSINANARYKGFELEALAIPVDRLSLSATVGYVKSRYKSFPLALNVGGMLNPGCLAITGTNGTAIGQDCYAIAVFTNSPKWNATIGANYSLPKASYGTWSIDVDYSWRSKIQFNTFNVPTTPYRDLIASRPYGLLSARITLSDIALSRNTQVQIAVYGDNLTDVAYNRYGVDFSSFASRTYGQPRTVGVEAKVVF